MELAEHFGTIWRRKWRILLATAVVVGLVFAWRNTRPRVYAATSLLSVTPARTSNGGASTKDEVQFLSDTYAALARSRRVLSSALSNGGPKISVRSEEHTSELQSRQYLVCRLLLEKKKNYIFVLQDCAGDWISRRRASHHGETISL